MKEKHQILTMGGTGLMCDNVECDFETNSIISPDDLQEYIDMPCPDCGENLLTAEDCAHHKSLHKIIKWVNILCWPIMFLIGGKKDEDCTLMRYHHHAGKTTVKREEGFDESL